jgi:hypothetical protein
LEVLQIPSVATAYSRRGFLIKAWDIGVILGLPSRSLTGSRAQSVEEINFSLLLISHVDG